jgi:hypothetical protein
MQTDWQIVQVEIQDSASSKKPKMNVAEETRPKRALIRTYRERNRKPQGRKAIKSSAPTKYHNWFAPLTWSTIRQAGELAGWRMSPTAIVKICQLRQPELFAKLTRETVKEWIDRSGEKPRWSESALRKAMAGNTPGHTKGGPRGAFVS